MKIAGRELSCDMRRIEAAAAVLGSPARLAVNAMNSYDWESAEAATDALSPLGLWWFEDICDPHDFPTQAAVSARYPGPVAAGEAIFSAQEAALLRQYGGLRDNRDFLLFDPVHCYGLPGYLRVVEEFEPNGWARDRFWPHGGHLFCLHLVKALGLGGAELNPFCFLPFGGLFEVAPVEAGEAGVPNLPRIGFEGSEPLMAVLRLLQ